MKTKTTKTKEKITKDMLLGEVVREYPKSIKVFFDHGLPCASCGVAFSETIEEGAMAHGVDLKSLLKDLNKIASKR